MEVNNPVISDQHAPAAGVITKASWQEETEENSDSQYMVFLALIDWDRKGVKGWFRDFHEGMLKSYERLGHKIDGLRATTLNVESTCIICRTHRLRDESDDESGIGSFLF